MSIVKESVEVAVPLHAAYHEWTLFEEFPRFMEGVDSVTRLDARHTHWRTTIDGVTREFDAEVVDQEPEELIAWQTADGGIYRKSTVTFRRLDAGHTRVSLAVDLRPGGGGGAAKPTAEARRALDHRVKGDLRRFKEYAEDRARGRIDPA
ncbi:SRPBCC family protein [Kitasatospora sp. NPDC036755]|uniref:SRPBCC family protein n=1 Tax=Kitasatospora sp. NPDC036755 TaxID=3154600 RepID=UPI0033D2E674